MRIAYLFSLLLLTTSLAAAQGPMPPRFIVQTLDGPLPPAPLVQVGDDFSVRLAGEQPKQVAGKNLVGMRQAALPLPRFLSQSVLLLSNGDRVPVSIAPGLRVEQDRLHFRPAFPLMSAKEVDLAMNYVAVLCLGKGDPVSLEEQDGMLAKWLPESRTRDVIVFNDGDRVEGTLKGLDFVRGATLSVNGKETPIPLDKIKAIAFNSEFRARPRGKGPFAHVVLANGGRLGFNKLRLDEGKDRLIGTTLFGLPMEFPLSEMRSLDIRQGAAVYLSELTATFEPTPYLGAAWPMTKDSSPSGTPLQLGLDFYDKGIGMHSQSRATFPLDGKYRWFETTVGLDERLGRLGRVRLKVLADGKELALTDPAAKEPAATSVVRTLQDGPLTLRLDVQGAKTLTLVVEFADFGNVQGHVNWANARLIKQ